MAGRIGWPSCYLPFFLAFFPFLEAFDLATAPPFESEADSY